MPDPDQLVSRLRRAYDAYNRGDFDAAVQIAHPEIEFVRPGAQSVIKGAAGMRAWAEPDAFEDQRIEATSFRVNGDRVLVRQRSTARGAGSGIELELDNWAVWTFDEDGLATRLENFLLHEEAEVTEAAGIKPQYDQDDQAGA